MKFEQIWTASRLVKGAVESEFPASVPGNVQKDYAAAMGWGDLSWMTNAKAYLDIEDDFWLYKTTVHAEAAPGERIFFVTHGIEYEYDVRLGGKTICHHVGMYTKVELDITDELKESRELSVLIYPHPKRPGAEPGRSMADQSCKPADEYGWDWHPRVLVSGLWEETYIETRGKGYIRDAEARYTLSDDLTKAQVKMEIDCDEACEITIWDGEGKVVYAGEKKEFTLSDIHLWWCNGQGDPYLYRYSVKSSENEVTGTIGFRKVRFVMNENAWVEPVLFPKGRSDAPVTIELNGRIVFAKGSNWVNPEVFTGTITPELYEKQVRYAKEAHMNIFRCWGGAVIDKEPFFEACDKYGIMVWQEFPLACNNYKGTPEYLAVLEPEARAILRRVRRHPCHVIWCGGNELFNNWSGMTDQSHALRLLNKLCYEEDFEVPFMMTSPIQGMGHGYYEFYDVERDISVFEMYRNESRTAYSEFGVPAIAELPQLQKIFTDEVIHDPKNAEPWELHHGMQAWRPDSWMSLDVVDALFGKQESMEDYIRITNMLECEGYRCIFEEARRQKGPCSMAINWDYNEPWITAAGNNLIAYPDIKKPAYYAVQSALRPVLPCARIEHFAYHPGDVMRAELWVINDTTESVSRRVEASVTVDGVTTPLTTWESGEVPALGKRLGNTVNFVLPDLPTQTFTLTLKYGEEENVYTLLLKNDPPAPRVPNALNF